MLDELETGKEAIDFLSKCECPEEYNIEPHGNGYALYFGRCVHRHGYNLLHITEVNRIDLLIHIKKLLNRKL